MTSLKHRHQQLLLLSIQLMASSGTAGPSGCSSWCWFSWLVPIGNTKNQNKNNQGINLLRAEVGGAKLLVHADRVCIRVVVCVKGDTLKTADKLLFSDQVI